MAISLNERKFIVNYARKKPSPAASASWRARAQLFWTASLSLLLRLTSLVADSSIFEEKGQMLGKTFHIFSIIL